MRKYFQRWCRSPILLDASIFFVFVKGKWFLFSFRVCCLYYKVCIPLTDNDLDQLLLERIVHYRNESVNEWKRKKTIIIFCFVQFSSRIGCSCSELIWCQMLQGLKYIVKYEFFFHMPFNKYSHIRRINMFLFTSLLCSILHELPWIRKMHGFQFWNEWSGFWNEVNSIMLS